MSTAYWITGDTLATLREMPTGSVDLVMTSPPFLALRSYLPADDPAKPLEIGQEGTPGAFLDVLLDITEELRRVLAPHGSICVELGDTYSGSGGAGGDYAAKGLREGQPKADGTGRRQRAADEALGILTPRKRPGPEKRDSMDGYPLDKSLCLIPELYRFALAYGMNPLTGRTTPRWRVRNVVRWVRPNPPVGALGDKFRPATSEMVIATMTRDRYFDLDAVRTPVTDAEWAKAGQASGESYQGTAAEGDGYAHERTRQPHPAGAPPLDWWEIPTHPYKGSHYATFPPALCEKPIKSMAPQKVCQVCGEPSRRITSEAEYIDGAGRVVEGKVWPSAMGDRSAHAAKTDGNVTRTTRTTGWTDCGHDAWRPGRVLDIFGGSGTTLAVATGHGRDAIGIDLDARNADLARDRIGPMFFHHVTVDELADILTPPTVEDAA